MKTPSAIRTVLFAVLACFYAASVSADATERFENSYDVAPGTEVQVININGNVHVGTWARDMVRVVAEKKTREDASELDKVEISVTQGQVFSIETRHNPLEGGDEDSFIGRLFSRLYSPNVKASVDYSITIPRNAGLTRAKTVNGRIEVVGTGGDTDIDVVNGSISVTDNPGRIVADITNGGISLNGGINVSRAKTVNGNIEAHLDRRLTGDVSLQTVNGSVTVGIPADSDVTIDFKTVNGSIRAGEIPITLEEMSRRRLLGRLGSGGPTISVNTVNGGINLDVSPQ